MGIRDRLETLSRGEMAGLIVVVVLVLAGAGLWYLRSLPSQVEIGMGDGAGLVAAGEPGGVTGEGTTGEGAPAPAGDGPLIVDVTGQVRKPGVYELPLGSRIIDAIEAAGGAKANADLSILNLASPLTDAMQVFVPKQGEAGVPGVGVPGAPGSGGGGIGADGLININLASATELQELPGIGEVMSQRIVDHRDANGPFTSVDQLEDVSGIGPSTMEDLRPLVTI